MIARLDQLPETRRLVLQHIKERGSATASEIAEKLGVSPEAARQQLAQLQTSGWVEGRNTRERGRTGRPSTTYSLTVAGENLFPKLYDELLGAVVHAIAERFGPQAPDEIWAAIADARTRGWQHLASRPDLRQRVEALRDLYARKDTYARVEAHADGYDLVELNCPFLNVALEHPALCSTSVNMLTRVLGRRVVREERFQQGAGRCVFRVYADQLDETSSFAPEPPQTATSPKPLQT
ncbi:MAG TPA: helix-turn-helix domain-containing protein [Thermoanaerobaculia bacterium]|nr:helix-turn-helix domain-containing protein [Thermoanaerobaculia bacterium]